MIRIVINNIVPLPKERPRFGGKHVYTPAKTKKYEELIAWEAKKIMKGRQPLTCPVKMLISFGFLVPKNCNVLDRHSIRPDLDNIVKSVTDALNGIVYKDDAQICWLIAEKEYWEIPGIVISVGEA